MSVMNCNKGLDHKEKLLFEVGDINKTGVDLPELENLNHMVGDSFSEDCIGLAGLSEPETIRHYVRLSRKNYSIDAGLYPLGSCTMKHNPRLNNVLYKRQKKKVFTPPPIRHFKEIESIHKDVLLILF